MKSILGPAAILLWSAGLTAASQPSTFDRTLPVSGTVLLEVRSDVGGIRITTGPSASVRVHAVLRPLYGRFDLGIAEAHIRALQQNPPIEQTGNHIRIGYADPALLRAVSMHLEIEAPHATQVQAQTTSGGIRIDGIEGPAATQTSSGRTEISHVAQEIRATGHSGAIIIYGAGGQVSARNESGGLQIVNARGPIELHTTSGRTEVSEIASEIHAATHSGSISIDNAKGAVTATNVSGSINAFQLAGPVQAETKSGAIRISQISPAPIRALADSGSIQVDLASRRGYLIDAQSDSGKVSGPRPNHFKNGADHHRFQEQLGAGGPLVDLDTHSSRIDIH